MGLLRLILALSVIVAHVAPWLGLRFFGGGVMAVECFYVLSGFYMALVLTERYRDSPGRFYFNRFIRLYPMYWLLAGGMLAAAALYWLVIGHPIAALADWTQPRPWWQQAWAAFSNLAIIGGDGVELLGYATNQGDHPLNRLLFIQPAWTLSVEIMFYLAAPWLLRLRLRWQFFALLAAAAIRCALWRFGTGGGEGGWSPWLYYFAPASWVFFLSGVFAFHAYRRAHLRPRLSKMMSPIGFLWLGALGVLIAGYAQLGFFHFQDWRFYLLFTLGLPFVFAATQTWKMDAWLAQWSYPLYLCHGAVISFYHPLRHFVPGALKIQVVIAASFALAAALLAVDKRIQYRFKRTDPTPHPAAS